MAKVNPYEKLQGSCKENFKEPSRNTGNINWRNQNRNLEAHHRISLQKYYQKKKKDHAVTLPFGSHTIPMKVQGIGAMSSRKMEIIFIRPIKDVSTSLSIIDLQWLTISQRD